MSMILSFLRLLFSTQLGAPPELAIHVCSKKTATAYLSVPLTLQALPLPVALIRLPGLQYI
jgi:hypothetical protein